MQSFFLYALMLNWLHKRTQFRCTTMEAIQEPINLLLATPPE